MASTNKTSKLGLSQYIGSDQPKYLLDYNGDMARIDAYIGKVTRAATVVVGLESSGYKAEQVDVLIKPTDNVSGKIAEAINKLPSIGGEIKLLEGEYNVGIVNSIIINKENLLFSGCGASTILIGANQFRINATNCTIENMQFVMTAQSSNIIPNDIAVVYVRGCLNNIEHKTISNWRNIYVDGIAEYVNPNIIQLPSGKNEPAIYPGWIVPEAKEYCSLTVDTGVATTTIVKEYNADFHSGQYFGAVVGGYMNSANDMTICSVLMVNGSCCGASYPGWGVRLNPFTFYNQTVRRKLK